MTRSGTWPTDQDGETRLEALEARVVELESAAADPWTGPPVPLDPPAPKPALVGPTLFPPPVLVTFPAKIETDEGSGEYTFTEQWLTDATTWADKTAGRTGTCYEINDVTGVAVGKIIEITIKHDTSGVVRYIFSWAGGIPAGTAENQMLEWDHANGKWIVLAAPDTDYKVLQRKADDSIGWDWVRAH